jgi:HEAT repeat protein
LLLHTVLGLALLGKPISLLHGDENQYLSKIDAHLLIGDAEGALQLIQQSLHALPPSAALYASAVQAAALADRERDMIAAWQRYAAAFPPEASAHNLLHEQMAWCILNRAAHSPSTIVRLCGLMAAAWSHEARSVDLLLQGCGDENSDIRAMTVKLMASFRDAPLSTAIIGLLKSERIRKVRIEALKTAGAMKIASSRSLLLGVVGDERYTMEEIAAATAGLIHLLETVGNDELRFLATSKRAALRQLACHVGGMVHHEEAPRLLLPLCKDSSADVRAAALHTLGLLLPSAHGDLQVEIIAAAELGADDPHANVAIAATWLLTIGNRLTNEQRWTRWLQHKRREVSLQAAAALATTGRAGIAFLKEQFIQASDPLVKLNLALGMIRQQVDVEIACAAVHQVLTGESMRLMQHEGTPFKGIWPAALSSKGDGLENGDTENVFVRLELLNMMAVVHSPLAQPALEAFLLQPNRSINSLACAMLLTEGDDDALQLVGNLLNHHDNRIRCEAAIILALWGRDERVVGILEEQFSSADRDQRERILEGLGRVALRSSIPFLLDKLSLPQPTLRVIAAASLLQCLNR